MTAERDRRIRMQFEQQVALGKSPSRALDWVAFNNGLKRADIRALVQTNPPATRRLTQHQEETSA